VGQAGAGVCAADGEMSPKTRAALRSIDFMDESGLKVTNGHAAGRECFCGIAHGTIKMIPGHGARGE
jgi:hypothetical protein